MHGGNGVVTDREVANVQLIDREYSGFGSAGLSSRCQPAGPGRVGRSASTEHSELVVRATEYGSVTRFITTEPVDGAKTLTSNR